MDMRKYEICGLELWEKRRFDIRASENAQSPRKPVAGRETRASASSLRKRQRTGAVQDAPRNLAAALEMARQRLEVLSPRRFALSDADCDRNTNTGPDLPARR